MTRTLKLISDLIAQIVAGAIVLFICALFLLACFVGPFIIDNSQAPIEIAAYVIVGVVLCAGVGSLLKCK